MIKPTQHPDWVLELLDYLKPEQERIINSRFFEAIRLGTLSKKQFQGALINFYPLIENFPQFMALNLAKLGGGGSEWNRQTRRWLMFNINVERRHADWWRNFAAGFGVDVGLLDAGVNPPPEMDAINHYLWHVCERGSLAEGISACNYAVEGPTGEWTKNLCGDFMKYSGVEGIEINKKTMQWVSAHASYDDKHPHQALEIIKAYATTPGARGKVRRAAKLSMEYYALALEACYRIFE